MFFPKVIIQLMFCVQKLTIQMKEFVNFKMNWIFGWTVRFQCAFLGCFFIFFLSFLEHSNGSSDRTYADGIRPAFDPAKVWNDFCRFFFEKIFFCSFVVMIVIGIGLVKMHWNCITITRVVEKHLFGIVNCEIKWVLVTLIWLVLKKSVSKRCMLWKIVSPMKSLIWLLFTLEKLKKMDVILL